MVKIRRASDLQRSRSREIPVLVSGHVFASSISLQVVNLVDVHPGIPVVPYPHHVFRATVHQICFVLKTANHAFLSSNCQIPVLASRISTTIFRIIRIFHKPTSHVWDDLLQINRHFLGVISP